MKERYVWWIQQQSEETHLEMQIPQHIDGNKVSIFSSEDESCESQKSQDNTGKQEYHNIQIFTNQKANSRVLSG